MNQRFQVLLILVAACGPLPSSANAQEPLTRNPEKPKPSVLPFQVRETATGLEVTTYAGNDHTLQPGDLVIRVADPEFTNQGKAVRSVANLHTEISRRQNQNSMIALWTKRGDFEPGWVLVSVAEKLHSNYVELPTELGGISLLAGFRATQKRPRQHGEFWGGITGPDGMDIEYSIWPVREGNGPRTSGDFVSDAERLAGEERKWFREQHIGGTLVQIALSRNGRLVVSYPRLGINASFAAKNEEQLANGLLILLSIPNTERSVPWSGALEMIEQGDVRSVTQFHSGLVIIAMASGQRYRTFQPTIDAVFEVLKECGKYDSVGIITQ